MGDLNMFKNAEKFLTTFNKIDKELKALLQSNDVGFSKTVRILRNSNAIVKRYNDELLEFAELRNAIVHNTVEMDQAIAEPHDSVVAKIVEIEKKLSRPKKVIDAYACEVYAFQESNALSDLLAVTREKSLSKFPIYNGDELQGMITQKGIANWMARNMKDSALPVVSTLLKDVLPFEEGKNYKFIGMHTSVYQAVEIFKEQISEGKRLEALLITKKGHPSETLLGIITAWDILEIP